MKNLILILAMLTSLTAVAQQEEKKTIQVYEYVNGIQNFIPTKTIEISPQKTEIYNNTNGIKNLTPETIIKPNGEVFKVENGIQQILPIQKIEIQTPSINNSPTIWFNPFN